MKEVLRSHAFFHLCKTDKKIVAEKIMDLGNMAASVLIFSQFITKNVYSFIWSTIGLVILLTTYVWSIIYLKGARNDSN